MSHSPDNITKQGISQKLKINLKAKKIINTPSITYKKKKNDRFKGLRYQIIVK